MYVVGVGTELKVRSAAILEDARRGWFEWV
jgi:hypothetical protein